MKKPASIPKKFVNKTKKLNLDKCSHIGAYCQGKKTRGGKLCGRAIGKDRKIPYCFHHFRQSDKYGKRVSLFENIEILEFWEGGLRFNISITKKRRRMKHFLKIRMMIEKFWRSSKFDQRFWKPQLNLFDTDSKDYTKYTLTEEGIQSLVDKEFIK